MFETGANLYLQKMVSNRDDLILLDEVENCMNILHIKYFTIPGLLELIENMKGVVGRIDLTNQPKTSFILFATFNQGVNLS